MTSREITDSMLILLFMIFELFLEKATRSTDSPLTKNAITLFFQNESTYLALIIEILWLHIY